MSGECFRSIDVSLRGTGYTYIVRVLVSNSEELIGYPVKDSNIRVRVEKNEEVVYFLEDQDLDSLDELRTANLVSIRDSVPDWVHS